MFNLTGQWFPGHFLVCSPVHEILKKNVCRKKVLRFVHLSLSAFFDAVLIDEFYQESCSWSTTDSWSNNTLYLSSGVKTRKKLRNWKPKHHDHISFPDISLTVVGPIAGSYRPTWQTTQTGHTVILHSKLTRFLCFIVLCCGRWWQL